MNIALKNPDITNIRQELHAYIDNVDDEALRDIYAKLKAEENEPYEWWNDDELVAELKQRADDVASGKDKGFTIEESKADLMNRLNKNGL